MNVAIKILSSVLVAAVLSSADAAGQTTDKANATHQAKTDTAKPGHNAEVAGKEVITPSRKTPPAEQPSKEEKKWGLQVVTGEKWYQVSIKLVM